MAIALEVTWVQRCPHPVLNEQIKYIGGSSRKFTWSHSREQAIESIEQGLFRYYITKDSMPLSLDVGRTLSGEKYLKLRSPEHPRTLLFDLPDSLQPAMTFAKSAVAESKY